MAGSFNLLVDPLGSRPIAPCYREAYPALSLIGVRRAWQDGRRVCEFHNERQEFVARVELLRWTDPALDIHHEWIVDGKRRMARVIFDILHRPSLTGRRMPDALCPRCRATVPTLHLMDGAWHCAACHGLVARATLLTGPEKKLLQVRQLYAEVHGRSPPVRGFRTWDAKRLKLHRLREQLQADDVAELREGVRAQVIASWVDHPFDAEPDEALTGINYHKAIKPVPIVSPWFG